MEQPAAVAGGPHATSPGETRPRGWIQVLRRVGTRINDDHIVIVAAGVAAIVRGQLTSIAAKSPTTLGWAAGLSVLIALWSATQGSRALMEGLEIALVVLFGGELNSAVEQRAKPAPAK